MTPNDKLPVDVRKNIWAEAERYAEEKVRAVNEEHFNVYNAHIAGATAWAPWFVKHNAIQSELHGVRAENDRLKEWKVKHDELQAAIDDKIDKALHAERNAIQAKITEMEIGYLKQAQRMADALEFIANSPVSANEREMVSWILTARALAVEQLQQFKDGGKEVGDE